MEVENNKAVNQSGRILVVDDYPMNRMKLVRILEQQGHTTAQAENGEEALAIMREEVFDVLLLDIIMPEMDGYQVLEHMRNDSALKDIPVIVISSLDEIESIVKCIELGAVDYLSKPFNPTILRARLQTSLQRKKLRDLERSYLQQEMMLRQSEKLATLGRLSAGMAHELNNPASAASRGTDQLKLALEKLEQSNQALNKAGLSDQKYSQLLDLKKHGQEQQLSSLERSEQEEVLEGCLVLHDIEDAWDMAPALVNLGYNEQSINELGGFFEEAQIPAVLAWLCATSNVHSLLEEIGQGTGRIAELVGVLKMYTFMDQAPVQAVDINQGLENTLVMLGSKLGDDISVVRAYADELPAIQAYGSELNQVWTHIIDNAIEAVNGRGEIIVRTSLLPEWVAVEIEDNGPGIPEELQSNVFDPFFTTKPPGSGTGMGLNLCHHIVVKHGGQIKVRSQPGSTCFEVRISLQGVANTEPLQTATS